jgi:proteasome accessory factor B
MTIVEIIRTYGKIIELVSSNIRHDSEGLKKKINQDLDLDNLISKRSLQRRLKELREEFHINIQYIQRSAVTQAGFEIQMDEEDYNLGNSSLIDKLSKSLTAFNNYKELKLNNNFVQISSESSAINSSYFQNAMRAIKNKKVLEIEYKKPLEEKDKFYQIHPLLIKEYHHKWYLVGVHNDVIKSFNIKRISFLEITDLVASQDKYAEAMEKLHSCIGVSYLNNSVETIKFVATLEQSKFLDQSPIHDSQIKEEATSEVALYRMNVIINDELKMKIMSYGSTLRVVEPLHFKEWYINTVTTMQKTVDADNINLIEAAKMFE